MDCNNFIWDGKDGAERYTILVTMRDGTNKCWEMIVGICLRESVSMVEGWQVYLLAMS